VNDISFYNNIVNSDAPNNVQSLVYFLVQGSAQEQNLVFMNCFVFFVKEFNVLHFFALFDSETKIHQKPSDVQITGQEFGNQKSSKFMNHLITGSCIKTNFINT
jgi:hypothetical protein